MRPSMAADIGRARGRANVALGLLVTTLVFLLFTGSAAAQVGTVQLSGRVLDATSRTPILGAIVMPLGSTAGYVTDSLGRFELRVPPHPEGYELIVEQLGYASLDVRLPAEAPENFYTVNLSPNPIALEGLEVLVDRFERRRRFFQGPVRVVDQRRLLRSAGTTFDIVRREVPFARLCSGSLQELCAYRRGQQIRIELCIDEAPAYGGLDQLEQYDPAELYMVEVFDQGREVRVYTRWFVDRALRETRRLQPLSWGCR